MDTLKQPIDNYGQVMKENLSMELGHLQIYGNNAAGYSVGASSNNSHSYQRSRYNRRMELSLQLAIMRSRT